VPAPRAGTRRRNVSFDPHAYERTAPPIIESEFLQSNNRGAVQCQESSKPFSVDKSPLKTAKHEHDTRTCKF
ncbi:hypothetical protein, partial [Bifidobacterium pseudocatenulatum]|uniref:hypothetical protein n=1 Tax=Bifidobacterium pseudocatenulatum TaxID=28026 RepID=UPI003DA63916